MIGPCFCIPYLACAVQSLLLSSAHPPPLREPYGVLMPTASGARHGDLSRACLRVAVVGQRSLLNCRSQNRPACLGPPPDQPRQGAPLPSDANPIGACNLGVYSQGLASAAAAVVTPSCIARGLGGRPLSSCGPGCCLMHAGDVSSDFEYVRE